MSRGIDYGMGKINIDKETGIRYGVIHQNEVLQEWCDVSEPVYGDPTCPKCGNNVTNPEETPDYDHEEWFLPYRKNGCCADYYCLSCEIYFDSQYAFPEEPIFYTYCDMDYLAEQESDGDIFITKSPYYTRAQFCSPCAPGACYLMNPCDDGEKAYCFGHDWFDNGKAPYPVFLVSDDSPVLPK